MSITSPATKILQATPPGMLTLLRDVVERGDPTWAPRYRLCRSAQREWLFEISWESAVAALNEDVLNERVLASAPGELAVAEGGTDGSQGENPSRSLKDALADSLSTLSWQVLSVARPSQCFKERLIYLLRSRTEFELLANMAYGALDAELRVCLVERGAETAYAVLATAQPLWEGLERFHAPTFADKRLRQTYLWIDARLGLRGQLNDQERLALSVQKIGEFCEARAILIRPGESDRDGEVLILPTGVDDFLPIHHYTRLIAPDEDRPRYAICEGESPIELSLEQKVDVRVRLVRSSKSAMHNAPPRLLRFNTKEAMRDFLWFVDYELLRRARFFTLPSAEQGPRLFYVLASESDVARMWISPEVWIGPKVVLSFAVLENLTALPDVEPTANESEACWAYVPVGWSLEPTIRIPKKHEMTRKWIQESLTSFLASLDPEIEPAGNGDVFVFDPEASDPRTTSGVEGPRYRVVRVSARDLQPLVEAYHWLVDPEWKGAKVERPEATTTAARVVYRQIIERFWSPTVARVMERLQGEVKLFEEALNLYCHCVQSWESTLQSQNEQLKATVELALEPLDSPPLREHLGRMLKVKERFDQTLANLREVCGNGEHS